jgi:hypothetical protein
MKKKITPRMLRALELNPTERLRLAVFVAGHRDWVARHAVPLETMLRRTLHSQGIQLLRLEQAAPHPVYELWLRVDRIPGATQPEIEQAVHRAFAAAGRPVKPEFARAVLREDRARVVVYVAD